MNLSKKRREESIQKIREIRSYIANAPQDDNTGTLLTYLSELEKDVKAKKYGLVFEEHREHIDDLLAHNTPVLTEEKDLFLDHGGQMNFLLEGDNLAALQLLLKTHRGKIDLIYIDPPYNTGNKDFIYNDDYVDKTDGFRHSKWISFMKKRLELAQSLLSEGGAIFISIDDNEQSSLKLICDEILGENHFVALIPWRKRTAKADVPHRLSQDYEWILCYAKKYFKAGIEKESRKYYETPDFPNRPWRIHDLTQQRTAEERPNSYFTIVNPKSGKKYPANPKATWRVTKDTYNSYFNENRIVFPGDYDFLKISRPVLRYWKADDEKKAGEHFGLMTVSAVLPKEVGMTQNGTKDLSDLFDEKTFSFPKPVSLLSYLLRIASPVPRRITVLDFFAGSGTTGQAVLKLNEQDNGARQFILCTNNENGICRDITYERIKRVIDKEQYRASLKYYRIDYIPIDEKLYYEYADELLRHIRELVELENGINFLENDEIAIVLTDEELESFVNRIGEFRKCKKLYLGHDVLPDGQQNAALKKRKIKINVIPQYYYTES